MAIQKETRILKSNTIEELRQKSNEISLHVGSDDLIDSRILDKTESLTAVANQIRFVYASPSSRFEFKPEEALDNLSGYIILKGSPSITGFDVGDVITQNATATVNGDVSSSTSVTLASGVEAIQIGQVVSGTGISGSPTVTAISGTSLTLSSSQSIADGVVLSFANTFSAKVVSKSSARILISNNAGIFTSGDALNDPDSNTIAGSSVVRLVIESYPVGLLRVFKDGTELSQGLGANDFHIPNFAGEITLSGSPTLTNFLEGAVIYQGTNNSIDSNTQTFKATILDVSASLIRVKNVEGSFNASTLIRLQGLSDTILGAQHGSLTTVSISEGKMVELNTPAASGDVIKIVSTDLVSAINEVQDDVGDITALNTNNQSDIVSSINELEVGIRGTSNNLVASDLNTTANDIVSAINEHGLEIGDVSVLDDAAGYTHTNIVPAITQIQGLIGNVTGTNMGTTATTVVTAIKEVQDDVNTRLLLTSGSEQTIDSDIQLSSGNTLEIPSGATLDVRNGLLQTGAGGFQVTTGFVDYNANINQRGLSFERSNFGLGPDTQLIFDQSVVASKPARAFRVVGLDDSSASETADLVTFYNAKELVANNTETGIDVTWDSSNQNFDFALTADPTIQLGNDLSGSVTLTNLATGTYTLTASINAGTVENSMLAGSIAASKLAGSIPNSKLSNPSWTITDGTNSTPVNLGDTLTIQGTAGEIEVVENSNTVSVGLPSNVDIDGNLVIGGDLTVQGTNTILNTTTLEVEDTLILTGTAGNEPSTGGFGIETRLFSGTSTPSGSASNVTGTHSLVYNFATDQWEADGVQILDTVNSLIVPQVKHNSGTAIDFSGTRDLNLIDGSGIAITGGLSGTNINFTITNSDRGSSQNIYKQFAADSGAMAVANSNNDTLTIRGGNNLTSVSSGTTQDIITIQHDNSGVSAGTYGSQFVVPRFTVDARGHVTGVTNQTAISLAELGYSGASNADNYGSFNIATNDTAGTSAVGSGNTLTINGGEAIDATRSGNTVTIAHSDTSSQASVNNSGMNFIQDVTLDTYGHVVGLGTTQATLSGLGYTGVTNADRYFSWSISDDIGNINAVLSGEQLDFRGGTGMDVTFGGAGNRTVTFTNTINSTSQLTNNSGFITSSSNITGNATTATRLQTARTIGGVSFNGTANINLPGVNTAGNQNTSGNAATATKVNNQLTIGNYLSGSAFDGENSQQWHVLGSTGNVANYLVARDANAYAYAVDFIASSDDRLKDKFGNIENAVDKVCSLNGFIYKWNEKAEYADDSSQVGVSAQEVEKVLPQAVVEQENGYLGVKYDKLVPLLIESIKELKAEIEELKVINKKVE